MTESYCNTPHVTCHICNSDSCHFRLCDMFFPSVVGFCLSFCILSCHAFSYHVIMCISFAYVFVSCIRAFSPLFVSQSDTPISSGAPFYLFSCVGVKHFWIGPRLVMRPWFTTGRPHVKFRTIWTSFDTPTVNRGTEKASFVLQPNTLPIWPKTHQRPFHHLERSITIAWPKTALIWSFLAPPTSIYRSPLEIHGSSSPKP